MLILTKPHLTEKTIAATSQSGFTFKVLPSATKSQIKQAVEQSFKVNVKRVTTHLTHVPGKKSQTRRLTSSDKIVKYATVYLQKGQSIALFEFKETQNSGKK